MGKFMQDLEFAWNLIWQPNQATKRKIQVWDALKLYYKVMILPFIAYVILSVASAAVGAPLVSSIIPTTSPLLGAGAGLGLAVAGVVVWLFAIIPLGTFINAAIYQVVARHLLHSWKGDYYKTFAAVLFSTFPLVIFSWLLVLPGVKLLLFSLFALWGLVLLLIGLAGQHGITRLNSAVTILLSVILVGLVVFLFVGGTSSLVIGHYLLTHQYSVTNLHNVSCTRLTC